jgi:hypothetical protein
MKNIMQNLIYRIAKFASTIPTTGARYANSMGRRLTLCAISVFNATMVLNGDDDGPKVRAAERASGRFMESCPDSIYSVYVKEVGENRNVFFGITFIRYTQIQMYKSFRER